MDILEKLAKACRGHFKHKLHAEDGMFGIKAEQHQVTERLQATAACEGWLICGPVFTGSGSFFMATKDYSDSRRVTVSKVNSKGIIWVRVEPTSTKTSIFSSDDMQALNLLLQQFLADRQKCATMHIGRRGLTLNLS